MKTIVIARYKEDVEWANDLNKFVVQKEEHLPNVGREPSSYLWYIITNYDALKGVYYFVQANPFDHCRDILNEIKSNETSFKWLGDKVHIDDMNGHPHDSIDLKSFIKAANISYDKPKIEFKAGCLFRISAKQLKQHNKEYYIHLFNLMQEEDLRYPWAFERFLEVIFKK